MASQIRSTRLERGRGDKACAKDGMRMGSAGVTGMRMRMGSAGREGRARDCFFCYCILAIGTLRLLQNFNTNFSTHKLEVLIS